MNKFKINSGTMNIIKKISITITSLLFAVAPASAQNKEKCEKPNIIYILADDMGYGDLSCYGQTHFQTPNIDKMAQNGIKFNHFYAGSALCAPSRCSLMTGKHTGHARIRANFAATNNRIALLPEDTTIPELLKSVGYSTGMFGKWGLGELGSEGTPTRKGFDEFFGYINQKHAHFYYYPELQHNEEPYSIPENQNGNRGIYTHDLIHQKAKEYIRQKAKSGNPFFVYLAYTPPHAELDVPEDDLSKFRGKFQETPFPETPSKGYRAQPEPFAAFCGMITRLDRHVGEIIALIDELKLNKNTIIIFTSDNGPHEEGGANPEFFNSNGGLRGIKRDLYDGGIREPMIMKWDGTIKPMQVTNHIAAAYDIMPTICDLVKIPVPAGCDGISFLPLLQGKSQQNKHEYLYWELGENSAFKQAVRIGDFKGVRYGTKKSIEIYNIINDPKESIDLSGSQPDLVAKVTNCFNTAHSEDPNFPMKDIAKSNKKKVAIDPDDNTR